MKRGLSGTLRYSLPMTQLSLPVLRTMRVLTGSSDDYCHEKTGDVTLTLEQHFCFLHESSERAVKRMLTRRERVAATGGQRSPSGGARPLEWSRVRKVSLSWKSVEFKNRRLLRPLVVSCGVPSVGQSRSIVVATYLSTGSE